MSKDVLERFAPTNQSLSITNGDIGRFRGDIFDLADAFLSISSMTHKKLQKLCYYAKAWYLAINDSNLVIEPFEAWVHGAVQPALYQKYRAFGFGLIPMFNDTEKVLPEEFVSFSREIYQVYGDLSGDDLERLNHSEVPWQKARKGIKPWQSSNAIINENDIKMYYRELMNHGKSKDSAT